MSLRYCSVCIQEAKIFNANYSVTQSNNSSFPSSAHVNSQQTNETYFETFTDNVYKLKINIFSV